MALNENEDELEIQEDINYVLRPENFQQYVGQQELIAKLQIAIAAAKERKEPLCSVLLGGPSGTGKTSIAKIVGNEYGTVCKTVMAPSVKTAADLIQLLSKVEENSFLFFDEIHALNIKLEEILYSAIEDFAISVKIGQRDLLHIPIKPFCLIGATTNIGSVSEPLRNRFGIVHSLTLYSDIELARIISANIQKLNLKIDNEGVCLDIAKRSRGIPRLANRLLARTRDFAQINNNNVITQATVEGAMELEGVDQNGLTNLDYAYLETLYKRFQPGSAVGLMSIASAMNQDRKYVEQAIEPLLLNKGLIIKTKQGRIITTEGVNYVIK